MWVGRNWMGVAAKAKDCSLQDCTNGQIIVGEIYWQLVFKRNQGYFYYPLHTTCVEEFGNKKYQEMKAARDAAKRIKRKNTTHLSGLDEETKRQRRRALQYIAWHKNRALDALAQRDGYRYELHVRYILARVYQVKHELGNVKVKSIKFNEIDSSIPYFKIIEKRAIAATIDELEPFDFDNPTVTVEQPEIDEPILIR